MKKIKTKKQEKMANTKNNQNQEARSDCKWTKKINNYMKQH